MFPDVSHFLKIKNNLTFEISFKTCIIKFIPRTNKQLRILDIESLFSNESPIYFNPNKRRAYRVILH